MRYVRFENDGRARYGLLEGEWIRALSAMPWEAYDLLDAVPLAETVLLSPVVPPNVIAAGLNYRQHAIESGMDLPQRPLLFLKATTSVIGPGETILRPAIAPDAVDFEAELAIVIGKTAKDVSPEDADRHILGYTCANDVSARDCQLHQDTQWARAKSFDTFCPLGPWIETALDPDAADLTARVNGQIMQQSNTSDMIFDARTLVSYCSQNMTLLPGTVILTGTPSGVGFARIPPVYLQRGDVVEVEIGGIGVLCNGVA